MPRRRTFGEYRRARAGRDGWTRRSNPSTRRLSAFGRLPHDGDATRYGVVGTLVRELLGFGGFGPVGVLDIGIESWHGWGCNAVALCCRFRGNLYNLGTSTLPRNRSHRRLADTPTPVPQIQAQHADSWPRPNTHRGHPGLAGSHRQIPLDFKLQQCPATKGLRNDILRPGE